MALWIIGKTAFLTMLKLKYTLYILMISTVPYQVQAKEIKDLSGLRLFQDLFH